MRCNIVGSCCNNGRYSLAAIESGTFQVGLMVIDFICALMIGVGVAGLPTTILVIQTCLPCRVARRVKSGRLTMTYVLPRSCGNHRQRSMLAIIMSMSRSDWRPLNFGSLSLVGIKVTGTKFPEFSFEREVTLGVGLVSVKRRTDIRDFHETRQNLAWIRRAAVVKNIATHARPMYAAD